MSLSDIKIPADPSDKQTTDAKSALPPVEFRVVRGVQTNEITIQDRQAPQDRYSTSSYRVYFLPIAFATRTSEPSLSLSAPGVSATTIRASGRRVASLLTEIPAPGLGTVLAFHDTVNFGAKGYYYCVGVNRVGVEAPPEHFVGAP